jgi:hypothetical protein
MNKAQTNKTIPNNKPDVITRDNEKGIRMLADIEISEDSNVIRKEAEKILKYKDLTIEIQRRWSVRKRDTSNNTGNGTHLKNHSENNWATHGESTKSRKYRKQTY